MNYVINGVAFSFGVSLQFTFQNTGEYLDVILQKFNLDINFCLHTFCDNLLH